MNNFKNRIKHINIKELISLYNENYSKNFLKTKYNVTPQDIQKILENNNIKIRNIKESLTKNIIKQREKTCLKKYNVINPSQIAEVKKIKKQKSLARFGVDNPSKAKYIKNKISGAYHRKTPNEKANIEKKRKLTNLKLYGKDNQFKRREIIEKNKLFLQEINPKTRNRRIIDKFYKIEKTLLKKYGKTFSQLGLEGSLKHKFSRPHKTICKELNEMNIDYEIEKHIDKYFIDVYVPEYNLIIEIFGDYWHCNPNQYYFNEKVNHPGQPNIKVEDIWIKDYKRL